MAVVALFTAGFSAVYIAGAVLFSTVGAALTEHRGLLLLCVGGAFVVVLALVSSGPGPQRA